MGPKWSICPKQKHFWKIIIIFIYLLAPFIVQNFKNILLADPELWGCAIFEPEMAHFPKWDFFQKTSWWAFFLSFMPIYMTKIKVKYYSINKILTIKEYWNLIGWGPFLAIAWESDFSQACSFCRMLMNHKNFHFTQIPDKTNDAIFFKSPKTLFWGHFQQFLVIFARWRFFPKNLALSHTTIYGTLTPC